MPRTTKGLETATQPRTAPADRPTPARDRTRRQPRPSPGVRGGLMADTTACKSEYDFTLVLTGITELTPEAENALFEAGCDDATISVRSGRVFLTFSRTARSLKDAILSAIRNVKQANIGADVLRVDVCNLV